MDSQVLSENELEILKVSYNSTFSWHLFDIVKREVIRYKTSYPEVTLVKLEAHSISKPDVLRGYCTAQVRLCLCKFDNGSVLGVKTKLEYVSDGVFSL